MWGAIAGAVGSIAGGLLNKKSAESSQSSSDYWNAQNIQLQKDFAKKGIRWKVADAKAAGLHPLAALGASTASFSPIPVGSVPDYSMGNAVAEMGQDISRAISATQSKSERAAELEQARQVQQRAIERQDKIDALNVERHKLDVSNMAIQNELLKSQLARAKSAQVGPGMPSNAFSSSRGGAVTADVTSPTGAVETLKSQTVSRNPKQPSLEAGSMAGFKEYRVGGKDWGFNVELPAASSPSEAFESAGEIMAPVYILGHNVLRGAEWLRNRYYKWNPRGSKLPAYRAGRYR